LTAPDSFTASFHFKHLEVMQRNFLRLMVVAISALVLSVSCKKGDDGKDGAPGTANVKFSPWFTPATYKKDTVFSIWGFSYTQAAPAITQNILDSGTVLVFGKLQGYNGLIWPAGHVGQLPITVTYMQSGVQNDTWQFKASLGNLNIRFQNDNNTYTSISNAHQFRYIIIPGGVPAGRGINLSYEEICRLYNVPL
jgi:hypothetical protein